MMKQISLADNTMQRHDYNTEQKLDSLGFVYEGLGTVVEMFK